MRQRAVVAELEQRALAGAALSKLLQEAVTLVAHALRVKYCTVLELLPAGDALLLRAGVGWKQGTVGQARVGTGTDSQAGYTLLRREAVIVEDLRRETRFSGPPLLHEHRVVSGVSVVIHGQDRPFGVLGAHTTRRRTFSKNDVHFLQAIANVLAAAIQRNRAEEALRASEERLRTVVANAPVVLFAIDQEGVFTLSEGKALETLGLRPGEVVGRSVFEVYRDSPQIIENVHRALAGETFTETVEVAGATFETRYAPIRDENGTIIGGMGVATDVTERRQAEEALRESEAKYRSIFETVQDIFYRTDAKGIITQISPSVERYGYTREELIGTQVLDVYENPAERLELLHALLERGEVVDYEVRLKTGDGRVVDTSVSARVLHSPDGTFAGVEGSLRDINERKRAEEALRESEERYRELFENANDIVYTHDLTGRFTSINRAAEEATGYTREEASQENIARVVAPEYLERARDMILRKVRGESTTTYELEIITKEGRRLPVEVSTRLIYKDGQPIGVQGIARDITERKRAERALRESEERYRSLVETSPDAITVTDLDSKIVMANQQAAALHGCDSTEEMIGRNALDFVDPEDRPRALENARKVLETGSIKNVEYTLVSRDGTRFPAELSASLIADAEGKPQCFIGVTRDISERKRFEEQLVHLANHDPLTGLFNRRRFQEELERHVAQAQRYGAEGAVLFMDLDQFKDVNDSLGHRAGDELLSILAGLLRDRLRQSDVLARAGGDEFAVLLPHTHAEEAQRVAGELLETLRRHTFLVGGQPVTITASIGVALFPTHGATAEELLSWADLAMYKAKEDGPNAYSLHTPDRDWQAEIESRLSWQNRIREAMEKGLFLLHAQPILDLRTNEISQYELLLRLPQGTTIVPADSFVHIAERFGLIQAIDRWVVGRAIQVIAEHQRAGRDLRLEVNLSGKAFADSELLPLIRQELATTSIDPGSLVLEVTETAAIANITEAQKFVRSLKALGCRFALDDFGVGFSSFYHLKHLPVDYLKIDGSFIRNLPHSPVDQHLVQAMVEVARGLGKQTIAEFVGSDETTRLLQQYGVDYAQGHHIGRPVDVSTILGREQPSRVGRRRARR